MDTRGTAADRRWLRAAIELSRRSSPSVTAYSVGALLVGADGTVLSTGYSRETDPADHAEELALARLGLPAGCGGEAPPPSPAQVFGATLYSSLEPCAVRASRPTPCADLIIASGIGRVAIAWTEPPILAPGGGVARLREAGVEVVEVPELAAAAREVNAHLLGD
jgi:diaminohydroxyphosphoribosylaminopyrimidine deaminase / 5-amino-6-(5-phosphoribosylamino)uracil reductase